MPAYKRQHYLPSAYLKYFSIDQGNCSRRSFVYRCDKQGQREVRVDSQCSAKWHYSRRDPAGAEAMFQRLEQEYCMCIDKLRRNQALDDKETGALLVNMFDLYIRNAVHENLTGKEGIEAYLVRGNMFWAQILVKKSGTVTEQDIKEHIYNSWGLQILTAPAQCQFVTSDHPSVWTSVNDFQPGLHLLTLPVTPALMAVAFDRRILRVVSEQMTNEDYLTLNGGQMFNSVSCLYSSVPFASDLLERMKKLFETKTRPDCKLEAGKWQTQIAGLATEHSFSFMQLTPPLM